MPVRYGLLKYSTRNLGDEIQSLAARRFLPKVDLLVDRDHLDQVAGPDPSKIILNGWFTHRPDNWPPSPALRPLFISTHISRLKVQTPAGRMRAADHLTQGAPLAYLKACQPIGCRDLATVELLRSHGVAAYFSGCLTLTLDRPPLPREDVVCCVDARKDVVRSLASRFGLDVQVMTHRLSEDELELDCDARFALAEQRLRRYATARLVITSRLHCVLPCLAFGTPVAYVFEHPEDERLSGLRELAHLFTPEQVLAGEARFDWRDPPPNPKDIGPLRRDLIDRCVAFVAEAPASGAGVPLPEPRRGTEAHLAALRLRLADHPDDVWRARELADLLLQAGRTVEAIPLLRRLVDARPDKVSWIRQLATALQEVGEPQNALAAWREVLSADPKDRQALKKIINLLKRMGRPHEAAPDLALAAAASPDHPSIRRWLARMPDGAARHVSPAEFHISRRPPVRAISEVLRQVSDADSLRSQDNVFLVLDPGGRTQRRRPVLALDGCGPAKSIAYRTAPKLVASIRNAVLVGRGVVLTETGAAIRELLPPSSQEKYGVIERDGALQFDHRQFEGRTLRVAAFDEPAFLLSGPTETAFGDWIINFGPRLALARAAGIDCRVVIRSRPQHRTIEMLEALGVPHDRILFHRRHMATVFPRLYVPSWPNGDKGVPMAGLFKVYRDWPIRPPPKRGLRLYLARDRSPLRPMVNEPEVRALFARRGFEVIDPGELTYQENRELFSAAACLAGPYGSAFHNLVYCSRRLHNLVLMPPHRPSHLTEIMLWHAEHGQTFSYVQGARVSGDPAETRWAAPLARVELALDALLQSLEAPRVRASGEGVRRESAPAAR